MSEIKARVYQRETPGLKYIEIQHRVSADSNDPDFHPMARYFKVFIDGEESKDVITASPAEGYAVMQQRDDKGFIVIEPMTKIPVKYIRKGNITVLCPEWIGIQFETNYKKPEEDNPEMNSNYLVDALRYRWLKQQRNLRLVSDGGTWAREDGSIFRASHQLSAGNTQFAPMPTLDEAIDAAIKVQSEQEDRINSI